jgi:uncharacterized protein
VLRASASADRSSLGRVPGPFAVPRGELFRHAGVRHDVTLAGRVPDLALSTTRLAADDDVVADLVLEAQGDAVTATGTVSAHWVGECRRCLELIEGEVTIELSEVFEPDPVDGETYPLGRDEVDLGPAVREALALALPLAPLCRDDCTGPDPDTHPITTAPDPAESSDDEPVPADPRWAALDALHFDNN